MDIWSEIQKLKGKPLYTLAQRQRFDIVAMDHKELIVRVASTGNERVIARLKIEKSYARLLDQGRIDTVELEKDYSPRHKTYIAAILSYLPGIKASTRPIVLSIERH